MTIYEVRGGRVGPTEREGSVYDDCSVSILLKEGGGEQGFLNPG